MSLKVYGGITRYMTRNNVIVVGGGAAGMLACGTAADTADKVYLIEKNSRLGRKLRITGKGRCNITNSAEIGEFFESVPTNPKFLYSAFYEFTNDDIIKLLNKFGVETKTERGGRVFPVSDKAEDVVDALSRFALKKNVTRIQDEVTEIIVSDGIAEGVKTKSGKEYFGKVIIATGGASYPLTGSDGSGYRLAEKSGHTVTDLIPSLIPVVTKEKWVCELSGLSLKNVTLTVKNQKNKVVFEELGEMLFTHFGVSGPLVLSASAHMKDISKNNYKMYIDLKPGLTFEKLDLRLIRDFEGEKNKDIINGLDTLLPKALIPVILDLAQINHRTKINSLTKEHRNSLAYTLKNVELTPVGFRPIEEAIITSGGIKVKEINPSTMESKLVKNLFFAGEIIDVDAYTGGFNLQIAWSTGYLAGLNAACME